MAKVNAENGPISGRTVSLRVPDIVKAVVLQYFNIGFVNIALGDRWLSCAVYFANIFFVFTYIIKDICVLSTQLNEVLFDLQRNKHLFAFFFYRCVGELCNMHSVKYITSGIPELTKLNGTQNTHTHQMTFSKKKSNHF